MSKRELVRNFLSDLLRRINDTNPLSDSESLVLSGRLSSLDVVETVTFLESNFDFTVDPAEFDLAQFDTVDNIVAMLEKPGAEKNA